MRKLLVPMLLLALGACSKPARHDYPIYRDEAPVGETTAADASTGADAAVDVENLKPPPENSPAASVPAGQPMLAYTYGFGIEAAPKAVRALTAQDQAACVSAGPALCQVTGSDVHELGADDVSATLELRAAPAWLSQFRERLSKEVRASGGRLVSTTVGSEDLSRQLVDTEAELRAKTTLRDRLQQILASRPGKVSDLVEVERELARVQGELDATQSELAVMRGRVAMSKVTLSYSSRGVLAPQGVLSPLSGALADTLSNVVESLAFMVRLIAVLLPWIAVTLGVAWVFRKPLGRWRERRRARRASRLEERRRPA